MNKRKNMLDFYSDEESETNQEKYIYETYFSKDEEEEEEEEEEDISVNRSKKKKEVSFEPKNFNSKNIFSKTRSLSFNSVNSNIALPKKKYGKMTIISKPQKKNINQTLNESSKSKENQKKFSKGPTWKELLIDQNPITKVPTSSLLSKNSLPWDLLQLFLLNQEDINNDKHSSMTQTTDLTFVCKERNIRAHKFIVERRADYFRSLFNHSFHDSKNNVIQVEDFVEFEDWRLIIEWMYCDVINCTFSNALNILLIADYYSISILRSCVETFILNNIDQIDAYVLFNKKISPKIKELWTEIVKTHRNVKSNGTFQNESASLVICFSLLRNESTNSFDVHFITKENTIIGAHSLIVGSRSSVLSKLVFSNRLNSPCCISVYRFSSKIVEHVCVWMYSDLFLQNLPTEEIDSIIELCKEWNLISAIEFLSSMQFRIDFEINLEDGITATESFLEKICDEADHVLRNHPNNNNNTNNNNVLF